MKILGISAFYHDSSAVLLNDGDLVCAVQEERFTRKKHDSGFPVQSIEFCLKNLSADCGRQGRFQNKHSSSALDAARGGGDDPDPHSFSALLKELDCIVYYDKPFLTFERLLETYLSYAPFRGFSSFKEVMPLWMGKKLNMRRLIRKELKKHFAVSEKDVPEILFSYHHLSHAASAFFPGPFEDSAVLCLDGVGEWATTTAWLGRGNSLQPLWQIDFPHSLGLFYSTFTEYCGFKVNSGEYKLMGLAPFGEPKYVSLLKDNVIDIKSDGSFRLNMDFFDYPHRFRMAGARMEELFKRPSRKIGQKGDEDAIDVFYMDMACSVQTILEEAVFQLARTLHKQTGVRNLSLAGGVALNCTANGKILENSPFSSLWIQPAAGDAGGALGAVYSVYHGFLKQPRLVPKKSDSMKGALLGPEYSDESIENFLDREKAVWTKYEEDRLLEELVAGLIQGQVAGWFQGRMEFGPRALGCRSILGDPRLRDMQKKINLKIKFRESFRPFALSILEEKTGDYFERAGHTHSPYMLLVSFVPQNQRKNTESNRSLKGLKKLSVARSSLPACTHVDYSTRIQTVGPTAHLRYRKLLQRFYERTSCPGIINTSFNVRGEPIVRSPEEAWRCFMGTDMDILCMGSYFLRKKDQKEVGFRRKARFFPPD